MGESDDKNKISRQQFLRHVGVLGAGAVASTVLAACNQAGAAVQAARTPEAAIAAATAAATTAPTPLP